MTSGYTGTITVPAPAIVSIGPEGLVQQGGTFDSSAVTGTIAVNGPTALSGGTFIAPAGTWETNSFTKSGSPNFNHTSGRFKITGEVANCNVSNIFANNQTFFDLELFSGCSRTFDLNNQNLTATNSLTLSGGDFRRGKITLTGTQITVGSFDSGNLDNGILEFAAAAHTIISASGGGLPHIDFNMLGAYEAKINGSVVIRGNVARPGQGAFGRVSDSHTIKFETPFQIGFGCVDTSLDLANSNFGQLHFSNSCGAPEKVFTIAGSPWIYGNLRFAPTAVVNNPMKVNGGTLNVEGGSAYVDNAVMMGGDTLVKLNNINSSILGGVAGGKFPSVEIAKTGSNLVTFTGEVGIAEDLLFTNGSIIAGGSTVVLYNLGAAPAKINFPNILDNLTFKKVAGSNSMIDLDSNLTVAGLLKFEHDGTSCFGIQDFDVFARGNFDYNCATSGASTSAIVFNGTNPVQLTAAAGAVMPAKMDIGLPNGIALTLMSPVTYYSSFVLRILNGNFNANFRPFHTDGGIYMGITGWMGNDSSVTGSGIGITGPGTSNRF